MSTVRRGRHLLERDGRSIFPVGAHYVPVEGPDWPWRVGVEEFDRAFGAMAAAGLDTVRIDLLWSAVEPEPGRELEVVRAPRRVPERDAADELTHVSLSR